MNEIRLYEVLQKNDDSDRRYIVQLLDISSFLSWRMSFMVLIYVQWTSMPRIRAASLQPLRHPPLQQFYWNEHPPCSADRLSGGFCSVHETQLFCALRYIHSDKNRIIHCDVKPENILLKQYHGFDIKLIDFGSSNHSGSSFFSYIQSRYYRAPEVMLGLPYDSSIDIWSVACVLVRKLFVLNLSSSCAQVFPCFEVGMNSSRSSSSPPC